MSKHKEKWKWLFIFFLVMLAAVAADQFTKYLAIENLQGKAPCVLIQNVLELQFFCNTGIAWSMLEGQMVFILFTGVVLLAVMFFFIMKLPEHKKYHILYVLFGVLAGGAVGNMIDRIRFGYVVDFIYVSLIHFPIFNVADMCIVISILIFAFLFVFYYKEEDLSFLNFKQKKYREVK